MIRTAATLSTITAFLLMLAGCAVQRPLRFTPKSISKIQYDPQRCTQTPDGRFRCKDVVFTVTSVDVK